MPVLTQGRRARRIALAPLAAAALGSALIGLGASPASAACVSPTPAPVVTDAPTPVATDAVPAAPVAVPNPAAPTVDPSASPTPTAAPSCEASAPAVGAPASDTPVAAAPQPPATVDGASTGSVPAAPAATVADQPSVVAPPTAVDETASAALVKALVAAGATPATTSSASGGQTTSTPAIKAKASGVSASNLLGAASAGVPASSILAFADLPLLPSSTFVQPPTIAPDLAVLPLTRLETVQPPLLAAAERSTNGVIWQAWRDGRVLPGVLILLSSVLVGLVGAGHLRVLQLRGVSARPLTAGTWRAGAPLAAGAWRVASLLRGELRTQLAHVPLSARLTSGRFGGLPRSRREVG